MEQQKVTNYGIYKNRAGLRLKLAPAKPNANGWPEPGGYFLTVAESVNGANSKYDWDNDICIFISAEEAMNFVQMLTVDHTIKIYHDPDKGKQNEGTRSKSIYVGVDDKKIFLNIQQGQRKIGIILSASEIETIAVLIRGSLCKAMGW